MVKTGKAVGTCPRCGKELSAPRPTSVAYCDCYRYCPNGHVMVPYTPEVAREAYDPDKGLRVLMWCPLCDPPHYSKEMPAEVNLS